MLTRAHHGSTGFGTRAPVPRRWMGDLLAALSLLWAAALPAAAWASASPDPPALRVAAAPVYLIGSLICHQIASRSFYFAGVPLPVCARCTGIYAGAAIAAALVWGQQRFGRTRRPWSPGAARVALVCAAIPAAVTLVYEWTTGHTPDHSVRAATGGLIGATAAWVVLAFVTSPDADLAVN